MCSSAGCFHIHKYVEWKLNAPCMSAQIIASRLKSSAIPGSPINQIQTFKGNSHLTNSTLPGIFQIGVRCQTVQINELHLRRLFAIWHTVVFQLPPQLWWWFDSGFSATLRNSRKISCVSFTYPTSGISVKSEVPSNSQYRRRSLNAWPSAVVLHRKLMTLWGAGC